jgi:hypothetical protein
MLVCMLLYAVACVARAELGWDLQDRSNQHEYEVLCIASCTALCHESWIEQGQVRSLLFRPVPPTQRKADTFLTSDFINVVRFSEPSGMSIYQPCMPGIRSAIHAVL